MIKKMTDSSRHYVNNKQLLEQIKEYQKANERALAEGKEQIQIPNSIGTAIFLICTNLAHRFNFRDYTYRDEMVEDGIVNCVAAVTKFDSTKSSNPYGYFSIIAYNAFVRRIHMERKQNYTKHKNMENMFVTFEDLDNELFHPGMPGTNQRTQADGIRRHYQVIDNFEKGLSDKKKKDKEKKKRKKRAG